MAKSQKEKRSAPVFLLLPLRLFALLLSCWCSPTSSDIRFGQGLHVQEVPDFLSPAEVDAVLKMARRMQSHRDEMHPAGPRPAHLWRAPGGQAAQSLESFKARSQSYDPEQLMELGSRWRYEQDEEDDPEGVYGVGSGSGGDGSGRSLLRRIEMRIGQYSMIPPHISEGPLMVGHRRPLGGVGGSSGSTSSTSSTSGSRGDSNPNGLRNVHHDLNNAPRRAVTALIYLTDVEVGGHTVFPCLGQEVDREFCAALVRGFKEGRRMLEPPDHGPKACFDPDAFGRAEELCAAAVMEAAAGNRTGGTAAAAAAAAAAPAAPTGTVTGAAATGAAASSPSSSPSSSSSSSLLGLRVKPERGKAVFFTSALRDGSPDMLKWHAGCPVLAGEKFTLQKFKEFPAEVHRVLREADRERSRDRHRDRQTRSQRRAPGAPHATVTQQVEEAWLQVDRQTRERGGAGQGDQGGGGRHSEL